MKLGTTVLVIWAGLDFFVGVTARSFCRVYDGGRLICLGASRETVFQGFKRQLATSYSIRISDSEINPLGTEEWSALRHAGEIYFTSTDVDQLPAVGFESFPCLSTLDMRHSKIEVIPQGAFPRTVNASLFRCPNSNFNTPESKLQRLDLINNRIHTIEDNSLMAPHLQYLDLRNNSIKCIDGKFRFLAVTEIGGGSLGVTAGPRTNCSARGLVSLGVVSVESCV
ncbi:insulin-like growth factor-binding protein complex acid labile chain [Elysia marginata]|uniref:Insulin-like growth factor-binding protein complex acid labile chain n=1 Tax=Elysia marginata TaxID=1093978 RepID=A0AAV4J1V2_9GAST|nr:insulin-like growth factor-binding protein complex acid labile chain [Elysia marginata]